MDDRDETRIISEIKQGGEDQTPTQTKQQTLARLHNLHGRQL
jgi:hypothetical protein